jgi:hypothetical protein
MKLGIRSRGSVVAIGCVVLMSGCGSSSGSRSSASVAATTTATATRATGSEWAAQEPAIPAGATHSHLEGVSCPSEKACIAVGLSLNGAGAQEPLTEILGAGGWVVQKAPLPDGGKIGRLHGVSCTTAKHCIAVGYVSNGSSDAVPVAASWDGRSWTVEKIPVPASSEASNLTSVSCATSDACTAVGDFLTRTNQHVPFAETLTGATWAVETLPTRAGTRSSYLEGVSCTAPGACVAAGDFVGRSGKPLPLVESSRDGSWKARELPVPAKAEETYIKAVSCSSSRACVAVGQFGTSSGEVVLLAERWDGRRWSAEEPPRPPGEIPSSSTRTDAYLTSASCTSPRDCVAAGDYLQTPNTRIPLAEKWNGKAWTVQELPNPPGVELGFIEGTSCSAPKTCTAVGHVQNGAGLQAPLAEQLG